MESLVHWLSSLPPVAIYATIAFLAFIESIVPPIPSDLMIAVAAFLAHDGTTNFFLVYALAVIFSVLGTAAVWLFAKHFGKRFFASPLGKRALPPRAVARIEREYLRFGVVGLLIARFIPGVRAVVPPFAGLFGISLGQMLIATTLGALVWYAVIIRLATFLGTEWSEVQAMLDRVGKTTAIIATACALGLVAFVWLRRRKAASAEPVSAEDSLVARMTDDGPIDPSNAARLIIEIAYADEGMDAEQRTRVEEDLRRQWGLAPRSATATIHAGEGAMTRLAERLTGRVSEHRRLALVEQMWEAAFSQGTLGREQEEWLLTRASELLQLGPDEIARVRQQYLGRNG